MSRRHNGTYNALKEYQKIQHDREMNKKHGYKIEIKKPNWTAIQNRQKEN